MSTIKNDPPSEDANPSTRDPRFVVTGFPSLSWEENNDELDTRPTPVHEQPLQARIDAQLAIVGEHHTRIALAIEKFWGHPDCMEYMQKLILSGGHSNGKNRVGFKPEVISALITLVSLHQLGK